MKYAPWVIIAILVVLLVLQRSCSRCDCDPTIVINDQVVINRDTQPQVVDLGQFKPVTITLPSDTIWRTADTLQLLKDCEDVFRDYYSIYDYFDTLKNDSSMLIILRAHTYKNNLFTDRLITLNRRETSIIHNQTLLNPLRNKIYAGVGIGRSPNEFGLAANLLLQNKKEHVYSVSYDLINKDVYFTMYWKINLRRNGKK